MSRGWSERLPSQNLFFPLGLNVVELRSTERILKQFYICELMAMIRYSALIELILTNYALFNSKLEMSTIDPDGIGSLGLHLVNNECIKLEKISPEAEN